MSDLARRLSTTMEAGFAGVRSAAENIIGGAVSATKGILHPAGPPTATFSHITSVPLPRASHSLSVVKGRAYIFGGEASPGVLADKDMHVVILPSSAVLDADYQSVKSRPSDPSGAVPAPRKGHSSVTVGDQICIFGGELAQGASEHEGRVWVFDTTTNKWKHFDPAPGSPYPPPRAWHGAASSENPPPKVQAVEQEPLPQQPRDPAKTVPDVPDPDSFGTLFVAGGQSTDPSEAGKLLNDAWSFDIRTRTWMALPPPPAPARTNPSLACCGDRLYRFGGLGTDAAGARLDWLDVSGVFKYNPSVGTDVGTRPLLAGWGWEEEQHDGSNAPDGGAGAQMIELTTGQRRGYLLAIGCEGVDAHDKGKAAVDVDVADVEGRHSLLGVWARHLPAAGAAAVAVKEKAREGLKTEEGHWAEVKYLYQTLDGDVTKTNPEAPGTKGLGPRVRFAAAKGTEVDGASVIVWGGVRPSGKVLSDGWMITVDR